MFPIKYFYSKWKSTDWSFIYYVSLETKIDFQLSLCDGEPVHSYHYNNVEPFTKSKNNILYTNLKLHNNKTTVELILT